MAAAAFFQDLVMVLMMLTCFMGYLRPKELTQLSGKQPIALVVGSGTKAWALLLAPWEAGARSKTAVFDESILLDWDLIRLMAPNLRRLKERAAGASLWGISHREYLRRLNRYVVASGVSVLKPTAHYSLRRGGASFDSLMRKRPLEEIKKRGRWVADGSVKRYEKHARVLKEVERLPPAVRQLG